MSCECFGLEAHATHASHTAHAAAHATGWRLVLLGLLNDHTLGRGEERGDARRVLKRRSHHLYNIVVVF